MLQAAHFQLRGERFDLTKDMIEDILERISPGKIRKHFVVVNGRRYPVKQVLAVTLNRPLVSFITTDAIRILANLGFEIGNLEASPIIRKTHSEELFEEYLRSSGLGYFFERPLKGSSQRPDYSLTVRGQDVLFEVREFREDVKHGGDIYDPYGAIRKKIEAARRKFKDLDDYCCCLVLFNEERPLVKLSWEFIYGAMLGDLVHTKQFDPEKGVARGKMADLGFDAGGKMISPGDGNRVAPQNRTISAILVLGHLSLGNRRFSASVKAFERQNSRKIELEEFWAMIEAARGTERDISLRQLRVVVQENPYARKPFPEDIFRGVYDERYGAHEGKILRKYSGVEIERLEAEEGRARS